MSTDLKQQAAPLWPGTSEEHDLRGRKKEPLLAVDQIQGNVFPGFSKDYITMLFLRITDLAEFATWLTHLIPFVATTQEVLSFNRLHKAMATRRQTQRHVLKTTWLNIAFSFEGLSALSGQGRRFKLNFHDRAFVDGLLNRSREGRMGDPVDTGLEGDPANWVVGGPNNEPHLVVLIASDDQKDLFDEVAYVERTIYAFTGSDGKRRRSGAEVIYKQEGAALPGRHHCHEHFGFLDSISQPGIRGRISETALLTPSENPHNIDQGKPGQDLVWPGEFVFGYPGQDATKSFIEPGLDPLRNPKRRAPAWAANGSFLVFRRLRQYVGVFHEFLRDTATQFDITPELLGAKLMGRWASGAPVVACPERDDASWSTDEHKRNNFEFSRDDFVPRARSGANGELLNVEEAPADPDGLSCPFVGHIRKAFPRNDSSRDLRDLDRSSTHTHRLLRRGIPYGEISASTPQAPIEDQIDRGLLFMAYQTSIEDQFEYVTKKFINDHNFSRHGMGYDPIVGQNDTLPNRWRPFKVHINGKLRHLSTYKEWVVPTGGSYFFAPSIDALLMLAGGTRARP